VDNQLLMFTELVEGVTIDQRLRQGPIPVHEGVEYVCQVLDALGYANQHGVIHRDIKPANRMATAAGAVLMDFGIAEAAAGRPRAQPMPHRQLRLQHPLRRPGIPQRSTNCEINGEARVARRSGMHQSRKF